MKKYAVGFKFIFAILVMFFSVDGTSQINSKSINNADGIVVLELFTSQGCSSCPSADEVLTKYVLANQPNIFPLAFHVDYWNYIGWKDPFSKAQYSEKQREYAKIFNSRSVYTPQLVINGKHELVGSAESKIDAIVKKESAFKTNSQIKILTCKLSANQLFVEVETSEINKNSKINYALVKKKEFTKIKRGENNGLAQTNYNIVFDFKTSIENSATFDFEDNKKPADFKVIAYIQNKNTRAISAATKSEISF